MTTCRADDMQQHNFYGDLEDYVCQMEKQQQAQSGADPDDVYAQLARKEKDLILAAELGKALLEKNEEISRANERLTEEYSQQLEVSLCLLFLLASKVSNTFYNQNSSFVIVET
ncbi:bicaudal D-related protein-like protein [Trichonephila clavata]|uniref:Bicaudal D-related protein-like protein n=1 Tax=Trichonephila clavata TaxID=2740835 RepID=A0A8X6FTU1_TRICU|nr:bicaudal D-related protein-like protein [Trichonephila clavata]